MANPPVGEYTPPTPWLKPEVLAEVLTHSSVRGKRILTDDDGDPVDPASWPRMGEEWLDKLITDISYTYWSPPLDPGQLKGFLLSNNNINRWLARWHLREDVFAIPSARPSLYDATASRALFYELFGAIASFREPGVINDFFQDLVAPLLGIPAATPVPSAMDTLTAQLESTTLATTDPVVR